MKKAAIIGGGACGLALAAVLKDTFSIEVFEKSNYTDFIVGDHVPYQLNALFDDLKVPTDILEENSLPCLNISGNWAGKAVEQEGLFNASYDKIINRPAFDSALSLWLQKEGVKIHKNATVLDITNSTVITRESTFNNYEIVFNCSGRNSNKADSNRLIFDQLIGVCFFEPKANTKSSSVIIESEEDGWWYFSHNNHYYVSTYFTDSDLLNKDEIDNRYQDKFSKIHGKQSNDFTKLTRPAFTSILEQIPNEPYCLGDAYMSFDPLSAQGIYKAFHDAYEFSNSLSKNQIPEFYKKKQSEFLDYMKQRKAFYSDGYKYYETEFYKRRIQ